MEVCIHSFVFLYSSNLEQQEAIKEIKLKYERTSKLDTDNASALQLELERLTQELENSQQTVKALEENAREARERKEDVEHWEAQIAEIIQWYSLNFTSVEFHMLNRH